MQELAKLTYKKFWGILAAILAPVVLYGMCGGFLIALIGILSEDTPVRIFGAIILAVSMLLAYPMVMCFKRFLGLKSSGFMDISYHLIRLNLERKLAEIREQKRNMP